MSMNKKEFRKNQIQKLLEKNKYEAVESSDRRSGGAYEAAG